MTTNSDRNASAVPAERRKPSDAQRLRVLSKAPDLTSVLNLMDEQAEAAVLAAVLHKPDIFAAVAEILQPSDFFSLWHGLIWWAFEELDRLNKAIDVLTVDKLLESKGKSDSLRLARLTSASPNIEHVESHAWIVRNLATARRTMQATVDIQALVMDKNAVLTSIDSVVDRANALLFEATEQRGVAESHIASAIPEYWDDMEFRAAGGVTPGVPSRWKSLDERLRGFQPGELAVVGGAAGMGKTSWMLALILNILQFKGSVALFSLEMTKREILQSLTAMVSGVPKSILKGGRMNDEQQRAFMAAMPMIRDFNLHVFDKEQYPELTPLQHKRAMRRLVAEVSVDISVIDGIWLMEPTLPDREGKRFRDVHHITRDLIQNADVLKMPILAMHQYKDAYTQRMTTNSRKRKAPVLSDFAESMAIQRNPQVVIGLHRSGMFQHTPINDDMYAYILKDRNNGLVDPFKPLRYPFDAKRSLYTEG